MKKMKKLFFQILGAFDWGQRNLPIRVNVNGKPLPFPASKWQSVIYYFEAVVFGRKTHRVIASIPGKGTTLIHTPEELIPFLLQGYEINMIDY